MWREQCSPLLSSEQEACAYREAHPECAYLRYLVPGVLESETDLRYPHVKITATNSEKYQQQYEIMEAINAENMDNGVVLLHDNFSLQVYSDRKLDAFLRDAVNHSYILPITKINIEVFKLLCCDEDNTLLEDIALKITEQLTQMIGDQIEDSRQGCELSEPKHQQRPIFSQQQIDLYEKIKDYGLEKKASAHLFFESDKLGIARVDAFQSIKRSMLLENGLFIAVFLNARKYPIANDFLFTENDGSLLPHVLREYITRDKNSSFELQRKSDQQEALKKMAESGIHLLCAAHFEGDKPSILGPYHLGAIQCKNELYSIFSRTNPFHKSNKTWPTYYEVMYIINGHNALKQQEKDKAHRWDIFANPEKINCHFVDSSDPTWEWGIKAEPITDELKAMFQSFNNISVLADSKTATHVIALPDAYFKLLNYCQQIRSIEEEENESLLKDIVHECEVFVQQQLINKKIHTVPREIMVAIKKYGQHTDYLLNYEELNKKYYRDYLHLSLINSFLLSVAKNINRSFSPIVGSKTMFFYFPINTSKGLYEKKIIISTCATIEDAKNLAVSFKMRSENLLISFTAFSTVFFDMVQNQKQYFYDVDLHKVVEYFFERLEKAAALPWNEQQEPLASKTFADALQLLNKGYVADHELSFSVAGNRASLFNHQQQTDVYPISTNHNERISEKIDSVKNGTQL